MDLVKASKRTAAAIIMLVLCLFVLNSADIRWNWYGEFPGVEAFRYQLNGKNPNGWIVLDPSSRTVVTSGAPDGEYSTLYLEQTEDGVNWHETFYMRYLPDSVEEGEQVAELPEEMEEVIEEEPEASTRFGFRGMLAPYSMGMTDFYNGHDIKDARYFTMTKYGAKADIEAFLDIGRHLSINLDTGYRFALKKETVIPNGEIMHFVKFGIGVDGVIPVGEKARVYAGVSGGALICINAGLWDLLPVMGAQIGLDIDITDNISIGFETGAEVSYGYDKDPLYRSISTYPDILSASVSYRF